MPGEVLRLHIQLASEWVRRPAYDDQWVLEQHLAGNRAIGKVRRHHPTEQQVQGTVA
ncbi:hypothetical protein D3C77_745960 [compost metagenome]